MEVWLLLQLEQRFAYSSALHPSNILTLVLTRRGKNPPRPPSAGKPTVLLYISSETPSFSTIQSTVLKFLAKMLEIYVFSHTITTVGTASTKGLH